MGQNYDYKSDTWMLGCILYELCTLKRPFEGDSLNVSFDIIANYFQIVINKIVSKTYPSLQECESAKHLKQFLPLFTQLLDMLLQKSTQLRASMDEVLSLPEVY